MSVSLRCSSYFYLFYLVPSNTCAMGGSQKLWYLSVHFEWPPLPPLASPGDGPWISISSWKFLLWGCVATIAGAHLPTNKGLRPGFHSIFHGQQGTSIVSPFSLFFSTMRNGSSQVSRIPSYQVCVSVPYSLARRSCRKDVSERERESGPHTHGGNELVIIGKRL